MTGDLSARTRERVRAQFRAGVPAQEIAKVLRLPLGQVGYLLGQLPDVELLEGLKCYLRALEDTTP